MEEELKNTIKKLQDQRDEIQNEAKRLCSSGYTDRVQHFASLIVLIDKQILELVDRVILNQ